MNGLVASSFLTVTTEANVRLQAAIQSSFSSVVDLPESDIVQTLVALVKIHRQQQQKASGDAMQVDNAPAAETPSLPTYLSLCIAYPNATSKGIVLGLKKWVRDPEDAVAIAEVLENWIRSLGQQRKANGEVGLLPSNKDLEKNEHGVWVVSGDKRSKKGKDSKKALPPLPKVCCRLESNSWIHAHRVCLGRVLPPVLHGCMLPPTPAICTIAQTPTATPNPSPRGSLVLRCT